MEIIGENCLQLSDKIYKETHDQSRPSLFSGNQSIFKVPERLRGGNEKAYEPHLLAIGPYHHQNERLKMEEYKKWYLRSFLKRRRVDENDFKSYVKAMKELENEARKCYKDECGGLGPDQFVKMMLYDGCFILELLYRFRSREKVDHDDCLIPGWINKKLVLDLLLLENQLPFFVVRKLFDMTRSHEEDEKPEFLTRAIINLFGASSVLRQLGKQVDDDFTTPDHILNLIHHQLSLMAPKKETSASEKLVHCIKQNFNCHRTIQGSGGSEIENGCSGIEIPKNISCATDLIEAGIKLKKSDSDNLFNINFRNGVLEIPRLEITDESESIFWNLIVYEQFHLKKESSINNYIKFMDCLINSSNDVGLLCRRNILHNGLGDHEVVATMFNRLGDFATLSSDSFYDQIFRDVNQYCDKRWNKWMANLMRRYFRNPWTLTSVLAASLLLLLTLAQTFFTILAYYKKS